MRDFCIICENVYKKNVFFEKVLDIPKKRFYTVTVGSADEIEVAETISSADPARLMPCAKGVPAEIRDRFTERSGLGHGRKCHELSHQFVVECYRKIRCYSFCMLHCILRLPQEGVYSFLVVFVFCKRKIGEKRNETNDF